MATANLQIARGTTQPFTYTHVEAMTGGTLFFTIKQSSSDSDADDSSAILKKTISVFTNGGLTASWSLTDEETWIKRGIYYYDIQFKDSAGNVYDPIFTGTIEITPHPTNRSVG